MSKSKGGQDSTIGFFIIGNDGTRWELYPNDQISLADHVGHTISVTGNTLKRSAEQEQTSQPYEKKEMGERKHHDLQVAGMKMVSETCKKQQTGGGPAPI